MGPLNSRNWKAQMISSDFSGSSWQITVAGEVQLPANPAAAVLTSRFPLTDKRPNVQLYLDEITFDGSGNPASDGGDWYKVGFIGEGLPDSVPQVVVLYSDQGIAMIDVDIVRS